MKWWASEGEWQLQIFCLQNDSSRLAFVDRNTSLSSVIAFAWIRSSQVPEGKICSTRVLDVINLQHHVLAVYRARGQEMGMMGSQSALPAELVVMCWD